RSGGQKSWRISQAASNASFDFREFYLFARLSRSRNGNQRTHAGHSIVNAGAVLRTAMQNCVGEVLDLQFVSVSIFAEWPMKLPVLNRKTFDVARFVKPGQKDFALNATVFAVDSEAFFEIASHWDRQFNMRQRAVGQVCFHKPAKGAEFLNGPDPDCGDFTGKETSRVHQVAAVGQHEIPALV